MLADIIHSYVLNTMVLRIGLYIFLVLTVSFQLFNSTQQTESSSSTFLDFYNFCFIIPHIEHDFIFLPNHTSLFTFAVAAMTPPLTGFFMRAAGLGQLHKEIEKQKRKREMARYNGMRCLTLVACCQVPLSSHPPVNPMMTSFMPLC